MADAATLVMRSFHAVLACGVLVGCAHSQTVDAPLSDVVTSHWADSATRSRFPA